MLWENIEFGTRGKPAAAAARRSKFGGPPPDGARAATIMSDGLGVRKGRSLSCWRFRSPILPGCIVPVNVLIGNVITGVTGLCPEGSNRVRVLNLYTPCAILYVKQLSCTEACFLVHIFVVSSTCFGTITVPSSGRPNSIGNHWTHLRWFVLTRNTQHFVRHVIIHLGVGPLGPDWHPSHDH